MSYVAPAIHDLAAARKDKPIAPRRSPAPWAEAVVARYRID